jgi:hypothetical protein
MRTIRRGIAVMLVVGCAMWAPPRARAGSFDDASTGRRMLYTAGAVTANVVPVAGSLVEPKCLPGYFFCKLTFAAGSVLFAGETLVMSGGSDMDQTRAILYRGFSGDWVVTPRDIAGERRPDLLPAPPPPSGEQPGGSGGFVPPPR